MFQKIWLLIAACLLLLAAPGCSGSKQTADDSAAAPKEQTELFISAAASLTDALEQLKTSYESQHPEVTLTFNFGGSGKLAQQIKQGAPADVFLSASQQDMNTLQEKKLIQTDSRQEFAKNTLVLIANKDHSPDVSSFEKIDPKQITHLAVGEPESVPAGRYTKETLEHLQLWAPLQSKLVLGSDVRQVLTYVESNNADLGIVYSSDAQMSDKVKVIAEAKPEWHEPIVYPGAVVASSEHPQAAQAFLDYLTSEQGKKILKTYGFN
ncbi:molybdate ABC transporter substrate-binding protein [Pseudobacillus badius]|uniref:molybdate ABC transporter substrate-binding protein n=1 Tax=Bacillus badius TaxID=1455 RepID=UPI003CEDD1AD